MNFSENVGILLPNWSSGWLYHTDVHLESIRKNDSLQLTQIIGFSVLTKLTANTKAGCSLYRAHCAVQEVSQNKIVLPITYAVHFRDISSTTVAEMETAAAEMETHNIVHTPTLSLIMKFGKKKD